MEIKMTNKDLLDEISSDQFDESSCELPTP